MKDMGNITISFDMLRMTIVERWSVENCHRDPDVSGVAIQNWIASFPALRPIGLPRADGLAMTE
jgi:hypothetical protein